MPYDVLKEKINNLPAQGLEELSHYLDYLCIIYNKENQTAAEEESLKKMREASLRTVWEELKNDSW